MMVRCSNHECQYCSTKQQYGVCKKLTKETIIVGRGSVGVSVVNTCELFQKKGGRDVDK